MPETQAVCRDLSAKVFLVRQFFQNANQSQFRVPDFQTEDATVTWRNGLTPSRPPEEQTSPWLRTKFCGSADLLFALATSGTHRLATSNAPTDQKFVPKCVTMKKWRAQKPPPSRNFWRMGGDIMPS